MDIHSIEVPNSEKVRQLLFVDPELLDHVWSDAVLLLEAGKKYWEEFATLESIYGALKNRTMQLWLVNDENEFLLGILTELIVHPTISEMRIVWIGGTDLDCAAELFLDYMELWAYKQGAFRVRVTGRKAWIRKLLPYGYSVESYTVTKDISHMREH